MTDFEAIERTKRGRKEAFTHLFERYNCILITWLQKQTKLEDVEDLAQEAWVKAYQNINKYTESNFMKWIATVAIRLHIEKLRIKKKIQVCPIEKEFVSVDEKYNEDDVTKLRKHIEKLPVDMKEVVILKTYYSLQHSQIIKVLNINSVNTSLSRYRKAVIRLRKELAVVYHP